MDKFISAVYEEQINMIGRILKEENQICLCAFDKTLLEIIVSKAASLFKKEGFKIKNISLEEEFTVTKERCIYLIPLNLCTSPTATKALYFYLEQSNLSNIKIIFYSTDCQSVDLLEKRVKSRFEDNVLVVPSLSLDDFYLLFYNVQREFKAPLEFLSHTLSKDLKSQLEKQYKISPTITALNQLYLKNKYRLNDFGIDLLLSKLNPIHLTLLILSLKVKLQYNNVVGEFKRFVSKTKELKNVKDNEILFYFYDLLDLNFINEKGAFTFSEIDLREFILSSSPSYLKRFIRGIKCK